MERPFHAIRCGLRQFRKGHDWTMVRRQRVHMDLDVSDDEGGWFTGTMFWARLSTLEGYAHTISSMLEGLFISVRSISCDGKEFDLASASVSEWATFRRGMMIGAYLSEPERIAAHLLPLVLDLHNLFYPKTASCDLREYRTDVTAAEVQAVCQSVCKHELQAFPSASS